MKMKWLCKREILSLSLCNHFLSPISAMSPWFWQFSSSLLYRESYLWKVITTFHTFTKHLLIRSGNWQAIRLLINVILKPYPNNTACINLVTLNYICSTHCSIKRSVAICRNFVPICFVSIISIFIDTKNLSPQLASKMLKILLMHAYTFLIELSDLSIFKSF